MTIASRTRRASAMLLTLTTLALTPWTPATATARRDPMQTPPRCENGRASWMAPSGLPVVVGTCDADTEASAPSPLGQPGPADCAVSSFDDRCEAWISPRYDGPWGDDDYPGFGSFERRTTVIAHPSEDLVFVGGTSTATSPDGLPEADFVQIAYRASTGKPLWTHTWAGLAERSLAYGTSIELSPDGDTLYALGLIAEPGVYAYGSALVAVDTTTGRRLWERPLAGWIDSIDAGVTTLPDGSTVERIYAVGGATAFALDASDGSSVWTTSTWEAPYGSRFNEVAVSPDGSMVFAAGAEHNNQYSGKNFLTVAFRASDGERLWTAREDRSDPDGFFGSNGLSGLRVTPDGKRVLVAGLDPIEKTYPETSSSAIVTIAYDAATGTRAWKQSYGGPVEGETHFYFSLFQGMLAISPDGRTAVVTGAINSGSATGTAAYDIGTGALRWGVESSDPQTVLNVVGGFYPRVEATNEKAFVSNRRDAGIAVVMTVTTAYGLSDGALTWTGRHGTSAQFGGSDVSPDGKRLYVAVADRQAGLGLADGTASYDILTLGYDA